jgi:(p)ppGpp synthase/HD superfamily hydrolase
MRKDKMMIDIAHELARYAHKNDIDKSGNDYFSAHVYPIAKKMEFEGYSEEYIATAYLHDVLEDSDIPVLLIRYIFGVEITDALLAVSRTGEETYEEYLVRVKSNKIAKSVKYYDIQNNLSYGRMNKLDEKTQARLKNKYAKALAFLAAP